MLNKSYYKKVNKPFYINGHTYTDSSGNKINQIFKEVNVNLFKKNLKACHVPQYIQK